MDDFFDDLDEELLQAASFHQPPFIPINDEDVEESKLESNEDENQQDRKIRRHSVFDISSVESEDGQVSTSIDNGYLTLKQRIGKGTYCKVNQVDCRVYRDIKNKITQEIEQVQGIQQMAVKIFNRKNLQKQIVNILDKNTGMLKLGNNLKVIYEEIQIWEKVSHANIIKIFELYDDINVPDLYLLMEYAKYGQIQDYSDTYQQSDPQFTFKRNQEIFQIALLKSQIIYNQNIIKFDKADQNEFEQVEMAAKWIFYQVAQGMQYLHDEMRICHRDLKHENIIMGQKSADPWCEDERQPTIKICDFTTSLIIPAGQEDTYKEHIQAGTKQFNAPEQFTEQDYLPKPLDVWAYGMCIYVYLFNTFPFPPGVMDDDKIENFIANSNFSQIIKDNLQGKFTDDLIQLLQNIFNKSPLERPTFKDILISPWFQGRIEENLSTEIDL